LIEQIDAAGTKTEFTYDRLVILKRKLLPLALESPLPGPTPTTWMVAKPQKHSQTPVYQQIITMRAVVASSVRKTPWAMARYPTRMQLVEQCTLQLWKIFPRILIR
jgi:hypothetical protein